MEEKAINLDLKGKRALVCGASQGIGAASAIELARLGATVVLLARDEAKLGGVLNALPGTGHERISADLTDRDGLRAKISSLVERAGPIEILVCNSGGPKGGPLIDATEDEFLRAFEAHIFANLLLVKLLLPGMRDKCYGRIVNIISTSVKAPLINLGVSNTTRGAVASWAKTLSLELAPFGVTVNNVLPGFTKTSRLESLIGATATRLGKSNADVEGLWKSTVPSGRFAEAEEIASAVAFLASPAASYINGINLPVDGGRTQSL